MSWNWAVSEKHKRWLDLDRFPWLHQSTSRYADVACVPDAPHKTVKCGILTLGAIDAAYVDWLENEETLAGRKVEASKENWPWKGIYTWFSEVGDGLVYLATDVMLNPPCPWQVKAEHRKDPLKVVDGWTKDSLFYADAKMKDFEELPDKGFVTISPSTYY